MKAKTIKGRSPEEIRSALDQSMSDGFTPTLAIVYMPCETDREKLYAVMDEKQLSIFGATSDLVFTDTEVVQDIIAVMLLAIDPERFKVVFRETGESNTYEIARQIGEAGKKYFDHPAFIIAFAGIYADSDRIVEGVEEMAGADVKLFGGGAIMQSDLDKAFIFTNGAMTHNGLVAIVIDEDTIHMSGLATCGWKPVGTTRTVTKSSGNEIFTIDDEPALDLVLKYLGVKFDLDNYLEVLLNIGAYFPLQLQRENADPVMRTAYMINKESRSLVCVGNVEQGSRLRFSLPPEFEVIEEVVEDCKGLRDERQNSADALLMFSCHMRYMSLGAMIGSEIEGVQQVWGSPLLGLFCAGEIGRSKKGKNEFHNNTCCVVVLKEK